MFPSRKGFAFNADRPGEMKVSQKIFEKILSTVDVTFQNLDSGEISLMDVSHYLDSDPTKVVDSTKVVERLRKDGKKKPKASIADTTTANAQVGTLSASARLDTRTKLDANDTFLTDAEMQKRLMDMNPSIHRREGS